MDRLAAFDSNVRALRDAGRDRPEARLLACPVCAHGVEDHRWGEPFDCLLPDCPCVLPDVWTADDPQAAFDRAWDA